MASRCVITSDSEVEESFRIPQTRKCITVATKLKILRRLDRGERIVDIARSLNLAESTVRTIRQSKMKIEECAEKVNTDSTTRLLHLRSSVMEKMEHLLCTWIEDQIQNRTILSPMIIQEKARALFQDLKTNEGSSDQLNLFKASSGWFERFKKRANLVKTEMTHGVSFDNSNEVYLDKLKAIINGGGYLPSQIFNVDEFGFYWKKMPNKTYIFDDDSTKDRLTILLGANAEGTFQLKPLLVYHNEDPKSLKGYIKSSLPVLWRANKKLQCTPTIFEEWFVSQFCTNVEKFCTENQIPFRVLLILGATPGHPTNLNDLSEHVRVEYIPQNLSIQPIQIIINAFKEEYLKQTFSQMIRETVGEGKPSIEKFWMGYNLMHGIKNIGTSWDELKETGLNSAWSRFFSNTSVAVHPENVILKEIVQLAHEVGFIEVREIDVFELLNSHNQEMSPDVLIALESANSDNEDGQRRQLTTHRLEQVFGLIQRVQSIVQDMDPLMNRSSAVCKDLQKAVDCYRVIYKEKQRSEGQTSLDTILTPAKRRRI